MGKTKKARKEPRFSTGVTLPMSVVDWLDERKVRKETDRSHEIGSIIKAAKALEESKGIIIEHLAGTA